MKENPRRPQTRHLKPCKPGETHNPNGRPKGKKNYATYMKEAMIEYAKKNGKTPEEVESLIYQQAINLMVRGEFSFHRDYMDRIHGKPKETIDLQGEIKTSKIAETQEILRKALKK